jgi:hypothetical protein
MTQETTPEEIFTQIKPRDTMKVITTLTTTKAKRSTEPSSKLNSTDFVELGPDRSFQCFLVREIDGHYEVLPAVDIIPNDTAHSSNLTYFWKKHVLIETEKAQENKSYPVTPAPLMAEAGQLTQPAIAPNMAMPTNSAIQQQLIDVGLLDPRPDGQWGPLTASAWNAACRAATGGENVEKNLANWQAIQKLTKVKDLKFAPKDPSNVENLLLVKALERMRSLGMHITISMGSPRPAYTFFYLAATNPDGSTNNDKINKFNDLRCLVEIDRNGVVTVKGCWYATVDAGWYYRYHPMNPGGALQVDRDKQFIGCSCVGVHGASRYEALVQAGWITGTRDKDANGPTPNDLPTAGNNQGSNDHHAFNAEEVDQNSAGCCVGQSQASHEKFMKLIKSDRRYLCNNGYRFARTILDGRKFL